METTQDQSVIDVSSLINNTEVMEIDPGANAFDRAKPLSDDEYKAAIGLPGTAEGQKNMLHEYPIKNGPNAGTKFYTVTAELKINEYVDVKKDPKFLQGKSRTFEKRFSSMSRMIDGKPTNEIATALIAMGYKIEGPVKVADLISTFIKALGGGGVVGVETQWEAQVETNDLNKNGNGKKTWKTVRRGEKNFPPDPGGGFNPEITVADPKNPTTTVQTRARAEIVRLFRVA